MKNSRFEGKKLYPHLFSPLRIGNVLLKNRIFAAPTSPALITTEGHFTPEMLAYLEEKAQGGAAVVTYGEGIVHSETGKSHNKQLRLDSFGVKEGLHYAASRINNAGAIANIQLSHGGKYGGLASVGGTYDLNKKAYGVSHEMTPVGEVLELSKEQILEIVASFGKAAGLVKDCGFNMVQVHAAHGWLFSQFLSPTLNRRKDEFGGSLENRLRILMMSLDSIRENVGEGFPIEIRLNGSDCVEGGLGLEDYIEIAKLLEDKVDLFNISVGNHENPELFCRTHPSAFFPRGVNVRYAAEIKKHVKKPVACVGSLIDPEQMEEIIASGQADIVEIGRGLLADPDIPEKALRGEGDDIMPCVRCYECFSATTQYEGIRCTVNPRIGNELFTPKLPERAQNPKRVLVAGGGPAGMMAALTCAQRGHQVTLVEKGEQLGGNLAAAGAAYFKEDIRRLLKILQKRVEKSSVKVLLQTEVTGEFVRSFAPEALFIAIGSEELRPPVPGLEKDNVIMAKDAELHPEKLGRRVAIMGGGLVGAELAVSCHHDGREVALIEMKPEICGDVNEFYKGALLPKVKDAAVCHTNTMVKEVKAEGVKCLCGDREVFIEADSIVCAFGFRSPTDKVDELYRACEGEVNILGDCQKVGKIYEAMNGAYYAALRI